MITLRISFPGKPLLGNSGIDNLPIGNPVSHPWYQLLSLRATSKEVSTVSIDLTFSRSGMLWPAK